MPLRLAGVPRTSDTEQQVSTACCHLDRHRPEARPAEHASSGERHPYDAAHQPCDTQTTTTTGRGSFYLRHRTAVRPLVQAASPAQHVLRAPKATRLGKDIHRMSAKSLIRVYWRRSHGRDKHRQQ